MQSYFRYWGKARKEGEDGPAYHLLPYHCLDVAAVGVELIRQWHRLGRFLAHSLELNEEALVGLFGYLLALHDLGKFARSFQGQREDLLQRLQGKTSGPPYTVRHDSLGYAYWQQYLWPQLKRLPGFAALGDGGLEYWASAVMGHHGKPPIPRKSATHRSFSVDDHFDSDDRTAAAEFADSIRGLLWNGAMEQCLACLDAKTFTARSRTCSWWLAGLTIAADWLGSNQDFFPYRSTSGDLREYWDYAQRQAEAAIAKTDLLPAICGLELNPEVLFDFLKTGLTPLQSLASTFSVATEPQLFVLEDVTGAGKTEAAVILANRLMAAGQADGIYFALPTMATSNAMYNRIEKIYGRLFAPGTKPSLVLAHGAARMSARFNASVVPIDQVREDERLSSERDSASARCNAWFADHRKKALLAHVGVGTIDQALLAVLHSKHQSLRALGLFGKLLVVDEVHACDGYMLGLLDKLLTLHARGGGSALLLSATLPLSTRRKLVNAFRKGLNLESQPLQSMAYPLLTHVRPSQSESFELPMATRSEVARKVAVDCLCDEAQVLDALIRTLKGGGCGCWIRNTVADALESYTRLLGDERFDASRIHLFHARFTSGDRLRIEDAALARFGKESTVEQRAGHLLIATQVVEQSLDVDFDLLVSDPGTHRSFDSEGGTLAAPCPRHQWQSFDGWNARSARIGPNDRIRAAGRRRDRGRLVPSFFPESFGGLSGSWPIVADGAPADGTQGIPDAGGCPDVDRRSLWRRCGIEHSGSAAWQVFRCRSRSVESESGGQVQRH